METNPKAHSPHAYQFQEKKEKKRKMKHRGFLPIS